MSSPSPKSLTIVAVHGVGDATPGDIARDLSAVLAKEQNPDAVFERADFFLEGAQYPRLKAENARLGDLPISEIIEANWADVLRPSNSILAVLRHILLLVVGMRYLSTQPVATPNGERTPVFARLYWGALERVIWWSAWLAIFIMLMASCGAGNRGMLWGIALGAPLTVALMANRMGKYCPGFRAGYFWIPVFMVAGASFVSGWGFPSPASWVPWSAYLYVGGQVLVAVTLTLGFSEALFLLGIPTWHKRFTRGAMLWIPFVIISALAVTTWVCALIFGAKAWDSNGHEMWQAAFLSALHYDLFWAEMGTLGAVTVTFFVTPLVGLAAYLSPAIRRVMRLPEKPGEAAHRMIAAIVFVGPLALFLGGLAFWISLFTGSSNTSMSKSILLVYMLSALRLGTIFPMFLSFVRTILDVAGDVIFHLQPRQSPVASQAHTLPRLEKLLGVLRKNRPENHIMVVAHSQGSVIAWTLLKNRTDLADTLVTVGSPLSVQYARLFEGSFDFDTSILPVRWTNLYRDGDYIGGGPSSDARTTYQLETADTPITGPT